MILFLDTSSEKCKIWLDQEYFEKEFGRDMAQDILTFLEESLTKIEKKYEDLIAIGFFAGPGSFTGLRIGASVVNTLADGLNIPIVAISKDEDWRKLAEKQLKNGENDKIVVPFYSRGANITKPRK